MNSSLGVMTSSVAIQEHSPCRKLVVRIAENGHTIQLDCHEASFVEDVQRCIEPLSGIQFSDQLLLCLDMKLEPQSHLSAYKLPRGDREVFLYNRLRLQKDSDAPPPERIIFPELVEPLSPSSSQNGHPLDNALDPALKALPSYERQFRSHFHSGRAIYESTQFKFEACKRLSGEQQVQQRALETARGVMEHHYRRLDNHYTDFVKCFSQQHYYHSDLLVNFSRDLDKLRSCKLHPALQTDSRICLSDLVKEENLRKWADNCKTTHKHFENKVLQLKNVFEELRNKAEQLNLSKASLNICEVETAIKDHRTYLTEQKSIMQSLSKDVNTVKKLVDDCSNCQLSASLRPHDAVAALGPMYDIHDKNHLPKMQDCDRAVSKLLDFCMTKKDGMNQFVHSFLQEIACIQSMVRDIRLQFPAFKEAMARQDDNFEGLKLLRGIGPAYRACLAEVIRRKATMKLYMGLAGQLAERLAENRDAEVRRREEFLREQSIYIPHDILASMGLFDFPSNCDVNVAQFDANLLDISISELDCYAPVTLLSMSSKHETSGSSKAMFANGCSKLSENSGYSGAISQNFDSGDLLEGIGSIEIAGTCKLEVENAKLKAELASALARLCCVRPEIDFALLDDSKLQTFLKNATDKTEKALQLKDEYGKQLQFILKMNQMQCLTYEKRIQELEGRLTNRFVQELQVPYGKEASNDANSMLKTDDSRSFICGNSEGPLTCVSGESTDATSCTSALVDPKLEQMGASIGNIHEETDENMTDLFGCLNQIGEVSAQISMDASMHDPRRDASQVLQNTGQETMNEQLNMSLCRTGGGHASDSIANDTLLSELQNALTDRLNQYNEILCQLKGANEVIASLRKELEISQNLLHESQINCAHLENCLHEAREEAHKNLCAADRRASEYNALRVSAVKMRGLCERLRNCLTASGAAGFASALHTLSLSLASGTNENEDDGTVEFRACIGVLVEKVTLLFRQREELLERCSRAETAQAHLVEELEDKKEAVKTLYTKHQMEKQASKEKISFGCFRLHELAAFVLNSGGHYEAVNRNCGNYYLSEESIALFAECFPGRPSYIIGQIVHIERRAVHAPVSGLSERVDSSDSDASTWMVTPGLGSVSNPYGLPVGCEYFIVTIAMLPDPINSLSS